MSLGMFRTIHYKHVVENQAGLVCLYRLIDKEAQKKKLMLLVYDDKFHLQAIGKPCGDEPVFSADCLEAIDKFISNIKGVA